jgi:hypothetical protein
MEMNLEEIKKLEQELYLLKHKKKCERCKKEFISKRTDSKYCSSKCCKLAWKEKRSSEQIARDNETSRLCMKKLREKRKMNGFK